MERIATIERNTFETQINLTLNLDGSGKCDVKNPIGFFDHVLQSFCKHGMFDLSGTLSGDLHVDQHHLIEDTGIVLGMCFAKALGNCAGIYRTGFFIYPMDESLLQASVDFGGRSFLVCNAQLSGIPLVSISRMESSPASRQTVLRISGRALSVVPNAISILTQYVEGQTTTRWRDCSRLRPAQSAWLLKSTHAGRETFHPQRVL